MRRAELQQEFYRRIERPGGDPDRLAEIEPQLAWMRDAGLVQVDCQWRWRGRAAGRPVPLDHPVKYVPGHVDRHLR